MTIYRLTPPPPPATTTLWDRDGCAWNLRHPPAGDPRPARWCFGEDGWAFGIRWEELIHARHPLSDIDPAATAKQETP